MRFLRENFEKVSFPVGKILRRWIFPQNLISTWQLPQIWFSTWILWNSIFMPKPPRRSFLEISTLRSSKKKHAFRAKKFLHWKFFEIQFLHGNSREFHLYVKEKTWKIRRVRGKPRGDVRRMQARPALSQSRWPQVEERRVHRGDVGGKSRLMNEPPPYESVSEWRRTVLLAHVWGTCVGGLRGSDKEENTDTLWSTREKRSSYDSVHVQTLVLFRASYSRLS